MEEISDRFNRVWSKQSAELQVAEATIVAMPHTIAVSDD
jgi:hypothetical protein